jgi:hypothetical protein
MVSLGYTSRGTNPVDFPAERRPNIHPKFPWLDIVSHRQRASESEVSSESHVDNIDEIPTRKRHLVQRIVCHVTGQYFELYTGMEFS